MFTHMMPVDMSDYVKIEDIVDNLVTRVTNKPLSANQGAVLKDMIDNINSSGSTVQELKLDGSDLVIVLTDGTEVRMDATSLLVDIKSISGSYDAATQAIIITLSDNNSFSIPVSSLLPVTTDDTISGNGSGIPLSVPQSDDTANILTLGSDGKLYVPRATLSSENDNGLSELSDGFYLGVENSTSSDSTTKVPTVHAVNALVAAQATDRMFLNTSHTFANPDHPTESEIEANIANYTNGVVYYNKTDDPSIEALQTWWIDNEGKATALRFYIPEPAQPTVVVVQDLSDPNTDDALSTAGIDALIKEGFEVVNQNYTVGDTSPILTITPTVSGVCKIVVSAQGMSGSDSYFTRGYRVLDSDNNVVADLGEGSIYIASSMFGGSDKNTHIPVVGYVTLQSGTTYTLVDYAVSGSVDSDCKGTAYANFVRRVA